MSLLFYLVLLCFVNIVALRDYVPKLCLKFHWGPILPYILYIIIYVNNNVSQLTACDLITQDRS